jgi:hypothetical protein
MTRWLLRYAPRFHGKKFKKKIPQKITNIISQKNFQKKFPKKISKKNFQKKFPKKISNFFFKLKKKLLCLTDCEKLGGLGLLV